MVLFQSKNYLPWDNFISHSEKLFNWLAYIKTRLQQLPTTSNPIHNSESFDHLTPLYIHSTLHEVENAKGKITTSVGKQIPAAHKQNYSDNDKSYENV